MTIPSQPRERTLVGWVVLRVGRRERMRSVLPGARLLHGKQRLSVGRGMLNSRAEALASLDRLPDLPSLIS
jgi:hypothetical protein